MSRGRAGRPKTPGLPRTKSGIGSRRREDLINAGKMVHTDYAVYFALVGEMTKIGYSGSLGLRMYALGYAEGVPAKIVGAVFVPSRSIALKLEAKMHEIFKPKIAKGREWFILSRSDVLGALNDCKRLGLRVIGGEDAAGDKAILSGMAYAADNDKLALPRVS